MTMSIIVVLIFKKGEVDSRGVTSNTATAGGGGGAPTPFPLYPQTQAPAYAQSYPQDSSYATDAFDNKGFVASSATVI